MDHHRPENPLSPGLASPEPAAPLGTLAAGLPGVTGQGQGWEAVTVTGIVLDSREVRPGSLFCALPGQHQHGIGHWDDAARRGASGLLTDRLAAWPTGAVGVRAAHARTVLAQMAERLYRDPGRELTLLGVTGTNGKTTTVHMIRHILAATNHRTAYWSTAWVNAGSPGGFRPHMTTPEAPVVQHFLRQARDAGKTHAVLEVSSHGIVLERLHGLPFQVGVATNVTPDHLDFHGSLTAYCAAKARFIQGLPADGTAVLNAEDALVRQFRTVTRARIAWFGWGHRHDAGAVDVASAPIETRFTLVGRDSARGVLVRLPLPGRHNILNALAAVLAAEAIGVPRDAAAAALDTFMPPVRRLEPWTVGPFTVINDVTMNRGGCEAVLTAMADVGRPLVVINAIRGNRGPEVNFDIGRTLGRWNRRLHFSPVIATTSDVELSELAVDYRVRPEELDAFLAGAQQEGLEVSIHRLLPSAIAEGVERLPQEGVLLLLGTFGMDDGPALAARLLSARVGVPFTGLARGAERGRQEGVLG